MVFSAFLLCITQIFIVSLPVCMTCAFSVSLSTSEHPAQAGILVWLANITNFEAGQHGSGERGGMDVGVLNLE